MKRNYNKSSRVLAFLPFKMACGVFVEMSWALNADPPKKLFTVFNDEFTLPAYFNSEYAGKESRIAGIAIQSKKPDYPEIIRAFPFYDIFEHFGLLPFRKDQNLKGKKIFEWREEHAKQYNSLSRLR